MMQGRMIRRSTFGAGLGMILSLWFPAVTPIAAAQNGGYRIAGIAVSSAGGHPLAGARVILRAVQESRRNLNPSPPQKMEGSGSRASLGENILWVASGRGFISGSYDQHDEYATAIVTEALVLIRKTWY